VPTAPSPHFDLGANVHAALRDWLRLAPKERTWDALLEFYRAAWRKNRPAFATRTRDELREWGERGKLMLRRFADEVPPDLEPVALEKSVRVDFGDLVVGGRVDRVDALPDARSRSSITRPASSRRTKRARARRTSPRRCTHAARAARSSIFPSPSSNTSTSTRWNAS
jgi:hypothetical protein